jgi:cytosolic iron-sulfur protein assembly protein CIAO1
MHLTLLPPLHPPSPNRAWHSTPHPTLPLLSTATGKTALITSLRTHAPHSALEGGHARSVRATAWKPHLPPGRLGLVTGSFDGTAGVWRRDEDGAGGMETEISSFGGARGGDGDGGDDEREEKEDWEFSVVLEGHDAEVKSLSFSPSGQYLATCSRDKSVWLWEEVDGADEWETVAVLTEHEGDVKCVAWAPDGDEGGECLASASYDGSVRVWREDGEGEWGCVAVLEGHEGTVWGVAWEGSGAKSDSERDESADAAPSRSTPRQSRMVTCSADTTLRVWRRVDGAPRAEAGTSWIPSTMRAPVQGETWECEAVLPKAHTRAVYAVAWSAETGRVVSCGGDGRVVVYGERASESVGRDGGGTGGKGGGKWEILATQEMGHGPYEINHVTWCRRFDGGEGEMVVSSGDDGAVRGWGVVE